MSSRGDSRLDGLGERLAALRHERGMTLADLAAASGVTKGFLSLVERGRKSVSVPTLLTICGALEVEIGALFDYPPEPVVRGGEGAPLHMGGSGIVEYLLTPASERNIQVMRTILEPGGGSGGQYRLKCDTIFVLVLAGTLELTVAAREYVLQTGDSTTFPGRTPHGWSNPGEAVAEVVWVLSPPLPDGPASERPVR